MAALKMTTIARYGDWRVRRIGRGPLYEVVEKGEKHGNIYGSKESAIVEAKRRARRE